MRRLHALAPLALAAWLGSHAQTEGPAAADRAFAARAAEVGANAAFLEVLSERGTLFRPGPVEGRAWIRENPDDGELAWQPRLEVVSAVGDLGFTLGPYTYAREGDVLGRGHFLSVWTRSEATAPWRLEADIGVAHGPSEAEPDYARLSDLPDPGDRDDSAASAERSVRAAEAELARAAVEVGPAAALLDRAHERLVVLRNGASPAFGLEACEGLLERNAVAGSAGLERVVVAGSSDLAAAWGALASSREGGPPGGWLRVWRRERDGAWRVLADVRLAPG